MPEDIFQPMLPGDWPDPSQTVEQLRGELTQRREDNAAKYHQLAAPGADGRRAVPDPVGVLAMRLAVALDHLFPDEESRVRFDLAFEQQMTIVLEDMLVKRRQAELLTPLQHKPGPGLLLPKAQP